MASKTLNDGLPQFIGPSVRRSEERAVVPSLTESRFGEFYGSTVRALSTYVYRVTGNGADADDVVQDAFCRLLRADVARLDENDLRRYLFRIAGNLIADRWRRSTREQSRLAALETIPSSGSASPTDPDVARTFATLKPRERALLWLAYVEGEDHEQISQSLGVAQRSIKVMLFRARARLRDLLESKGLGGRT